MNNKEIENELDLIWIKQEETQNVLSNQDDVIQQVINRLTDIELKTVNITPAHINNLVAIEVEKKFTNFIDVITMVIDKKIGCGYSEEQFL